MKQRDPADLPALMARRFWRRLLIVVLACGFAFTWLGWIVHDMSSRADQAAAAAVQACDQLQRLGYPCPFDPAKFRGAPGAQGPDGPQGPPGRPPTEAEIAAVVQVWLTANPPADGRPPTAEEIAAAVTVYLLAHPPPAGPQGEPGPAPTTEQILTAVQTYLAAHPIPNCPAGSHIEEYKPRHDQRTFLLCVKETPSPSPKPSKRS